RGTRIVVKRFLGKRDRYTTGGIPAYAEMKVKKLPEAAKKPKPNKPYSRLRGNDSGAVSVFSDKFLKLKISSFLQKQKTKIRNLKFVIPAQAGIQCVEFQLLKIIFETIIPSFPPKFEYRHSKDSANL
ncbi:hypothetical protein M5Z82_10955, partial [Neisseria meningitidis]|nr:hypothetical protein [Neisseria meningitidis]